MYALDALAETGVWRTLKRALNYAKLELQPLEMFFPFGTSALKPEPVDLNVKIVLIGDPELYELLYGFLFLWRKRADDIGEVLSGHGCLPFVVYPGETSLALPAR